VGEKRPRAEASAETDEVGAEREVALAAVKKFLRAFAALPVDTLGDAEVTEKVEGLRDELRAEAGGNSALRAMLPQLVA
jgi:hypothetical protein